MCWWAHAGPAHRRFGRRLLSRGNLIEDVEDTVIPAPLLLGLRYTWRTALQMPVADNQTRGAQPTRLQDVPIGR
jgi:hypothetical protein